MSVRVHDREPEPTPPSPSAPLPESVRRAIESVSSWMRAELGLVMSGVRAMTRDVQALVADVKDVFAALSVRLALVETRVAAMDNREPPDGPRAPSNRCRRRTRPRPPGGRDCRGRRPDH